MRYRHVPFDDVDGCHHPLSNEIKNKERKMKPRINKSIMLAAVFVLSPLAIANLYGRFSVQSNPGTIKTFNISSTIELKDNFTVSIKIYQGVNVYGWQTNVLFDPTKLTILEVSAGNFLAADSIVFNSITGGITGKQPNNVKIGDAMLCYAADIRSNLMLIFGCRWGAVTGVSGDGTVAKITFGVINNAQGPYYLDLGNPVLVDKLGGISSEGWLAIEQS